MAVVRLKLAAAVLLSKFALIYSANLQARSWLVRAHELDHLVPRFARVGC